MKLARSSLSLCLAALLLVLLLAAPAVAQNPAEPSPVRLDYSVYFGGLNVVELGIDVDLDSDSYDVTSRLKTIGMAGWLVPWNSVFTSEGTVNGDRLLPRRHRSNAELRGKPRTVAIDFADDDVAALRVHPSARDDFDRDEVPRHAMRGTVDPLSALLAVSRRIAAAGGCAGTVPVFDGRRRYDVEVTEIGPEQLASNDYNSDSGPSLRCDFRFVPIYGYDLKRGDPEMRQRRFRTGRAWFAEVLPGRPAVPVLVEIDSEVASTLVHLRTAGPVTAASDLPARD